MPLIIAFVAAAMTLLLWLSWASWRRRRLAFQRIAAQLGLRFSAKDPFNTLDIPFELFTRSYGRRISHRRKGARNFLWGELHGVPVRVFDYSYFTEDMDGDRTWHSYGCAVAKLRVRCPHLMLGRETLFTRVGRRLGFRDIEFDSPAFDRTFRVRSKDEAFARALIDAKMRAWLRSLDKRWAFEIVEQYVLCAAPPRLRPDDVVRLLRTAVLFVTHLHSHLQELPRDAIQ